MSKSIMQDKRGGECYLCNSLLEIDAPAPNREEHHIMYGTANRRLSEHYGLKVYLCPYHHRTGPEAAHRSRRTDLLLKRAAQRAFEQKYGREKWMEVFGRNYLDQDTDDTQPEAAGHKPAATRKNQQNEPFSQINISQNTPSGFCFLERSPGKEGP